MNNWNHVLDLWKDVVENAIDIEVKIALQPALRTR